MFADDNDGAIKWEVVITRYCEDISWMDEFPVYFERTVYDKSGGGPRQRIHLPGWSSADGPDGANLWPDAIALPNIGCESHAHMHHIVERWDDLAWYTAFLSGDGPKNHIPDLVQRVTADMKAQKPYVPYGDPYTCDADGRPNTDGLPELREAWAIFYPYTEIPRTFHWHGFSMYMASAERIQRHSRKTWETARAWCDTKAKSLAMERMYDTLFG